MANSDAGKTQATSGASEIAPRTVNTLLGCTPPSLCMPDFCCLVALRANCLSAMFFHSVMHALPVRAEPRIWLWAPHGRSQQEVMTLRTLRGGG